MIGIVVLFNISLLIYVSRQLLSAYNRLASCMATSKYKPNLEGILAAEDIVMIDSQSLRFSMHDNPSKRLQ